MEKGSNESLNLRFNLPPGIEDSPEYKFEKKELYSEKKSKIQFFYESRIRSIIKLILESDLPEKSKILDLGCGGGNISLSLISYGFDVYSVDIKPKNLIWFNKKAKINSMESCPVISNACNLPFREHIFDCVVATEIIEHLYRPAIFIETIKKVLKNDGILVLSTPNRDAINLTKAPKFSKIEKETDSNFILPAELDFERNQPKHKGANHVFEFSEKELIYFLKKHGLDICEVIKSSNKIFGNIGIKLFNYNKLLSMDVKYADCIFSDIFYNAIIVKCIKKYL